MRTLILSIAFGIVIAISGATTADASSRCRGANPSNNACAAFWYQAGKNAARGANHAVVREQKPRTVTRRSNARSTSGMSCAIFEQASTGPLVAYAGYYEDRDNARVIGSVSPKWKRHGKYYRAVACFDKSKMKGEPVITVCGEVGHYEFDGAEATQFKRQSGPLGSDDIARMRKGG